MRRKSRDSGTGSFAKNLRRLMDEREMTVREAAKIAGVSVSTAGDWRSGTLPQDFMAVKKLAQALGVSLSFLLTGEDETRAADSQPSITEVFADGGALFDGYAKITIQRLIPRKGDKQ